MDVQRELMFQLYLYLATEISVKNILLIGSIYEYVGSSRKLYKKISTSNIIFMFHKYPGVHVRSVLNENVLIVITWGRELRALGAQAPSKKEASSRVAMMSKVGADSPGGLADLKHSTSSMAFRNSAPR